jgi:anionic cell wall polymer biosynthesis LytR-Cps2A-Psr (LCP) family protein
VIEVNFRDFPELVDSMGGINVENKSKICSPQFDPFKGPVNFPKGDIHLNGRQALAFARVRKNNCAPAEDDRNRAKRQQEVITAIRSRVLSPVGFIRLPWISWEAPQTITTDMGGPSLMAVFGDIATAGTQDAAPILTPSGPGPGGSLLISDAAKTSAVDKLLGKK